MSRLIYVLRGENTGGALCSRRVGSGVADAETALFQKVVVQEAAQVWQACGAHIPCFELF